MMDRLELMLKFPASPPETAELQDIAVREHEYRKGFIDGQIAMRDEPAASAETALRDDEIENIWIRTFDGELPVPKEAAIRAVIRRREFARAIEQRIRGSHE